MTTATIAEVAVADVRVCAIEDLKESKYNPRKHFNEKQLESLAESIRAKGVINPLIVRPVNGHMEIVGGARRYRAAKLAGQKKIPCIVRQLSDQEALEVSVIDNLQRKDVQPLEEADGFAALLKQKGYDVAAIAAKTGMTQGYVYQRLKLAELIEPAKKALVEERITFSHAILIARLTQDDQEAALERCIPKVDTSGMSERDWNYDAREEQVLLPTRILQQWIADELHADLSKMPWDQADPKLVAKAGPCTTCPKRTGNAPELFNDVTKPSICTDRACFKEKFNAWIDRQIQELHNTNTKVIVISEEDYNWRLPAIADRAGVKRHKEWHHLNKKKCRNQGIGIVFEGKERGKLLPVCTAASCSVHNPKPSYSRHNSYSSQPEKPKAAEAIAKEKDKQRLAELKEKRDGELNAAIFRATLDAGPAKLDVEELRELARDYVDAEPPPELDRIYPWLEGYGNKDKHVDKLAEKDILRLLRAQALSHYDAIDESRLAAACKRWKVDVDGIKKQFKKGWDAEDAGKKYAEPTCGRCECTEDNACEGGCSWVLLDRATNCGICSACATAADHKKAAAVAGKKAAKKKSKK